MPCGGLRRLQWSPASNPRRSFTVKLASAYNSCWPPCSVMYCSLTLAQAARTNHSPALLLCAQVRRRPAALLQRVATAASVGAAVRQHPYHRRPPAAARHGNRQLPLPPRGHAARAHAPPRAPLPLGAPQPPPWPRDPWVVRHAGVRQARTRCRAWGCKGGAWGRGCAARSCGKGGGGASGEWGRMERACGWRGGGRWDGADSEEEAEAAAGAAAAAEAAGGEPQGAHGGAGGDGRGWYVVVGERGSERGCGGDGWCSGGAVTKGRGRQWAAAVVGGEHDGWG